jgi:hypothetical protein
MDNVIFSLSATVIGCVGLYDFLAGSKIELRLLKSAMDIALSERAKIFPMCVCIVSKLLTDPIFLDRIPNPFFLKCGLIPKSDPTRQLASDQQSMQCKSFKTFFS